MLSICNDEQIRSEMVRSNPDCETVVSGRCKEMSDRSVLMVEKSPSSIVVFP